VTEHLESRLVAVEGQLLLMTRLLWAVLAMSLCGMAVLLFRAWH